MDIRDFILEETEKNTDAKSKERKKTAPTIKYSVQLWSDPDLVIKRETKTTSTLLVLLFSQGQFYIKNEKSGTVDMLNADNLYTFCKGVDDGYETGAWILPHLPKGKEERERFVRTLGDETFVRLCAKGYLSADAGFSFQYRWQTRGKYVSLLSIANKYDDKPLDAIAKVCREEDSPKPYFMGGETRIPFDETSMVFVDHIENVYGHSTAMEFLKEGYRVWKDNFFPLGGNLSMFRGFDGYRRPGRCTINPQEHIVDNYIHKGIKFKDLSNYLFVDLPRQGFPSFQHAFQEWTDYMKMQLDIYKEIRDRYPQYLASEHLKLSQKHNLLRQKIDEETWKRRVKALEANAFTRKTEHGIQRIAPPKTQQDMLDAANSLSNCLSSYVDSFLSGRSDIYLLTDESKDNKKVIAAIEVKNGCIYQAKERFNQVIKASNADIILDWINKNNFEIVTRDLRVA